MKTITISDETWRKIKGQIEEDEREKMDDFEGMELLSDDSLAKKWLHENQPSNNNVHRQIRHIQGIPVLLLKLPNCNDSWTFSAWQYAMDFCRKIGSPYPIHYASKIYDNSRYIYIKI